MHVPCLVHWVVYVWACMFAYMGLMLHVSCICACGCVLVYACVCVLIHLYPLVCVRFFTYTGSPYVHITQEARRIYADVRPREPRRPKYKREWGDEGLVEGGAWDW
jgi:hypothetical protein